MRNLLFILLFSTSVFAQEETISHTELAINLYNKFDVNLTRKIKITVLGSRFDSGMVKNPTTKFEDVSLSYENGLLKISHADKNVRYYNLDSVIEISTDINKKESELYILLR